MKIENKVALTRDSCLVVVFHSLDYTYNTLHTVDR